MNPFLIEREQRLLKTKIQCLYPIGKSAKLIPFKGFPNHQHHVIKLIRTCKFLIYKELNQAGLWSYLFETH